MYEWEVIQKIEEQHHVTKKNTSNKLRNRQSKIFGKKKVYSISLDQGFLTGGKFTPLG